MSPRRAPADPWPIPGQDPTERARHVARAAVAELADADAERARAFVARMSALGQDWIAPHVAQYTMDDQLTVTEAAEYCRVKPGTVDQWRRRGLRSIRTPSGGVRVILRDLLEFEADRRRRAPGGGKSG